MLEISTMESLLAFHHVIKLIWKLDVQCITRGGGNKRQVITALKELISGNIQKSIAVQREACIYKRKIEWKKRILKMYQ
jgi:hypothetical protein